MDRFESPSASWRPSFSLHAQRALMAALAAGALGCGGSPPITTCIAEGALEPICEFQNPEDLAVLGDGRTLLVSQFGAMDGSRPGNLAVFDTLRRELRVAYEGGGNETGSEGWGDPDCPGAPSAAFTPHGFDLAVRPDGRLQLLVVDHGGREAIEFFEVEPAGMDTALHWRGCAVAPPDGYLNDVVATPEGGLLTTHMMPKSSESLSLFKAMVLGQDTGFVYRWSSTDGWSKVPGTDAPFPNGLELAPDGQSVYLNVYLGDEVRHIDLASGRLLGRVGVAQPDNVTWSSDESVLLVASHTAGMRDSMTCLELSEGSCPMAFEIVALDPKTLARKIVVAHAGPPMGGATVAVQVGQDLWLGTFAGDRVARVVGGASALAP